MIYLFHGSDIEKTRRKAFEWVEAARAKEPNLVYVRLAREELTAAALLDVASAGGLFVSRLLVLLDDPFPSARVASDDDEEETVSASVLEDALESLAASNNVILILAPKLATAKVKKISALAKHVYVYEKAAAREDARGFNSGLVNALAARASEKLWLEIMRATRAGDAPEMLHGLLHWKARDLMEKGGRAWKPEESRRLSLDLIELLQSSRRGGLPLDLALEKFALSL
ncbi:MAG: hypothetical protein AAB442_01120 [Patescibacteria group bacterium]